ncbi:MAG: hypothetical protein IJH12_01845 [Clostridia bacterium]|nr:hypothetical protein [Clostridia bacterium]
MKDNQKHNYLYAKASEIRWAAPKLIADGKWDEVRNLISISNEYWSGPEANQYCKISEEAIEKHSREAVVNFLPSFIERSIVKRKESNDRVTKRIKEALKGILKY